MGKKDKLHQQLQGEISDPSNSGSSAIIGGKPFVHLHVQSAFSLLESALPLAKIIDLATSDDQPALAVTDRNNMFGALEFSEKATQHP